MKNFILFILMLLMSFEVFSYKTTSEKVDNQEINEKNISEKMIEINKNEVLWLKKKYNIVRIRGGCLWSEKTELPIMKQEQEVFLKYGNTFWQRIDNEVDSIERKNLGYKKVQFYDLEKYLKRNNCTMNIPEKTQKKYLSAWVGLKINIIGQLSKIEVNTKYSETQFGKMKCKNFNSRLQNILSKAPLIKPSTFLNQGIDDSTFVGIRLIN